MPSLLLHLAAIERLAAEPEPLPEEIARALGEDVEYARLGAVLADLPELQGVAGGLGQLFSNREIPRFSRLMHSRAPVAMGLKMAELVATGALVGKEPGMAFVSGYFSHLCLDRMLHPLVDRLVRRHRLPGENDRATHRRIEWLQGLFYLRSKYGHELVGTRQIRGMLQVSKRGGPPRGIGRGLYELLRLSARETMREAPSKAEVDAWLRGLYVFGLLLASPVGRMKAIPAYASLSELELFRGPEVDYPAEVDAAMEATRALLVRLAALIRRGRFSPRSQEKFLLEFPEGSVEPCAA